MNSRCLKLYRAYSILFNSTNVGKFLWTWILKDCIKAQKKKKKIVVLCSGPRQNVQRRQRNVQKSVMHVQSCCFARNLNLFRFWRSRSRRQWRDHLTETRSQITASIISQFFFKTLEGYEPMTFRLADRCSPNWANWPVAGYLEECGFYSRIIRKILGTTR